jgi:integrase
MTLRPVPSITWLKRDDRTGVYYIRKFKAGKGEIVRSTGERTLSKAKTVGERMLAEFIAGPAEAPKTRRNVEDACRELAAALEADYRNGDRRERTWHHDITYLDYLTEHMGSVLLDEINEAWWADWVRTVGKRQKRRLFDVAKYLSKVLTYSHRRGWIPRKPAILNPDKAVRAGRVLSPEEVSKICNVADPRLIVQITLAYECGMRTSEILKLEWKDLEITPDRVTAHLREEKVKANPRSIELSPNAAAMIRGLAREGGTRGWVFSSVVMPQRHERDAVLTRRWRRSCRRAGIQGRVRFYDLRHSFFTRALLEKELPVQQVSLYGGTSMAMLQKVYLHGAPERTRSVSLAVEIPGSAAIRNKFGTNEEERR